MRILHSALVGAALTLCAAPAGAKPKGCGKLSLVENWSGTFSFSTSHTDRFVIPDQGGMEKTFTWSASGSFELRPAFQDGSRRENGWRGEEQEYSATAREEERTLTEEPSQQFKVVSITNNGLAENNNSGFLELNCEQGTYDLHVHVGRFKMKRQLELAPVLKSFCAKAKAAGPKDEGALPGRMLCGLLDSKQADFEKDSPTFDVSLSTGDRRFDPDSPSLSGSAKIETNQSLYSGKPLEGTLSWSLSPGKQKPPELVFEPPEKDGYEKWFPAPMPEDAHGVEFGGKPLLVKLRFQTKQNGAAQPKGKIALTLEDVSSHAGRCNNFPHGVAMKDDLRFSAKQPDGVVVDSPTSAHTKEEVTEVTVAIEAMDTGAHGKLKATCERLSLKAEHKATGKLHLAIPKDDDDNHVADGWEKQYGLASESADWDEDDEPAGQDQTGDGSSLYREYRGFVVLEGGKKVFKRTNPRLRELFVLDDAGILDRALWQKASGIPAFKLDESLVQGGGDPKASRVVDFTMGGGGGQHKYAVRVRKIGGMVDGDCPGDGQLACTANEGGGPPRDSDFCKVFPDRIRLSIHWLARWLEVALANPDSPQGQTLASSGLPPFLAQRALERLGEGTREELVRQMVAVITIHEVGHACGLPGHVVTDEKGEQVESSQGEKSCPMRYLDSTDKSARSVLQVLFKLDQDLPVTYSAFCRAGGYACFKHLNVRD